MTRYDYILFDADNTLFDFDRAEHLALRAVLEARGYPFTAETEALYLDINRALWARFDRGEVTQDFLAVERFAALSRALGGQDDPVEFNRDYLARLAKNGHLLPGAEDLCRSLFPYCTMAIVTNGLSSAQRGRLSACPIGHLFSHIFISQEMGVAKPNTAFFDQVCAAMGISNRRRAVVMGDSLFSDIQGGQNAGIDTIWYNPRRASAPPSIRPTWEADSFPAAARILLPFF